MLSSPPGAQQPRGLPPLASASPAGGSDPHAGISEGSEPASSQQPSHAASLAAAAARLPQSPAPQHPPQHSHCLQRAHRHCFRWGPPQRSKVSPRHPSTALVQPLGHPREALLASSLPAGKRSQGLAAAQGWGSRLPLSRLALRLFRSILGGCWQPVLQCFITQQLRLPPAPVLQGVQAAVAAASGKGSCRSSAQKCSCLLAASGLLPCSRATGTRQGGGSHR